MDADLYDEFGNYIGPELESDDDDDESDEEGEREEPAYGAGDVSNSPDMMFVKTYNKTVIIRFILLVFFVLQWNEIVHILHCIQGKE